MDRTFNSIGSHVFFEFGKEKKVEFIKGKKVIEKEWSIWLSHASWRIIKNNEYIVGSGDSSKSIQSSIQKLLGNRFRSLSFLSQFLDAEFKFEDGYQITTFFNWMEEDQWIIFLPDDTNVVVDCSSETALKKVQSIASECQIIESYKKLNIPFQEGVISEITYNEKDLPIFHFQENFSLSLEACAWRLEKTNNYVIGCLDDNFRNKLPLLIGKKLKQIDIANSMMDARFQFEDGFTLKTFSCCHIEEQWKILRGKELVFSAKISFLEN